MTIKEVIECQRSTGNMLFLRQGLFYRGYNQSAALLNALFGYRVKCKEIKSCGGKVFYVGFPASVAGKVVEQIVSDGGTVVRVDDGLIEVGSAGICYDESLLAAKAEPARESRRATQTTGRPATLIGQIVAFDLQRHTPIDCMNFISALQQQLR